jgi:hypothetical protein
MKHRSPFFRHFGRLLLALLAAAPVARADSLLITEVVTDPQGDHSENAGGNAVPFDSIPGSGTVSSVDEFVELHNGSADIVDLRGFALDFLDSTPSRYVFGDTSGGVLRFSPGSAVEALLPGAFVLLGNPPGALNNALSIELRDPGGALADAWVEVDANATSALDEALTRRWDGVAFGSGLERGAISPLGPPPPSAPEPASWLLVAVSALAAVRATRRTGSHAKPRKRRGSPCPPESSRRGAPTAS